jgi:hypothetical protein
MNIPDDALDEFIAIYRAEFGEEISHKDANEMALRVLKFYELLERKLPNREKMTPAATQQTDDRPPIGFRI